MALVNITNVVVHNNPSPLQGNLCFEVTFQCLHAIPDIIEWKLTYIGAKKDQSGDQVLVEFQMGPLEPGVMQFNIESNPPNYGLVPLEAIFDVTALLIEGSYHGKEYFRLGYYMHHQYVDEQLKENPPDQIVWDRLQRVILVDKPIITKPQIEWDSGVSTQLVAGDNAMVNLVGDPFAETSGIFDQLQAAQIGNQNQLIKNAWGTI